MTGKQAGGHRAIGGSAASLILGLPRGTKRLIMLGADAIAIPTALWAALALKFDRLDPSLDRTFAYFLVAIGSALFFFAMFGLYRAVIRFVGPKAMLTVIAGVSLSVLVLAGFDRFLPATRFRCPRLESTGRWPAVRRGQPLRGALPVPGAFRRQACRRARRDIRRRQRRSAGVLGASRRTGL